MSSRNVIVFGAVLVGASGAAQVLAGMDDNLLWQVTLMMVTGGLGGYGAWLSAAEPLKKNLIDPASEGFTFAGCILSILQ